MKRVLAFDMNGTLLDTGALDPHFRNVFGTSSARREWFDQMIELSMVSTITGQYSEFPTLGQAALDMIAARRAVSLSGAHRTEILQAVKNLPAFPDVKPALERLQHAGFRLVVLTNSPLSGAEHSLSNAGIRGYFEEVLSVETVQQFKPAAGVYRTAAAKLSIPPSAMMLIAAHSWDITGAMRAGCSAAFIARPGEALDPLGPRPEFVATEMLALVEDLLRARAA